MQSQLTDDARTDIQAALTILKQGGMIVVSDSTEREDEGDIVMAAEFATPEAINFIVKEARGLICVPMLPERAVQLQLASMTPYNQDPHQTAFTVSVDAVDTRTGISAIERSTTILRLAASDAKAQDFRRPGHIFPLVAKGGGVLERPGHTEASIELMQLAGCQPVAVICEILQDDGDMARGQSLQAFCQRHQLKHISIELLRAYVLERQPDKKQKAAVASYHGYQPLSSALIPTPYGEFMMVAFHNERGGEPHLALIHGEVQHKQNVIVRVHSECQTGDIFHSLRCDCGPQLDFAMRTISESQAGILVYLRQEGRGIGLVEKLKAYQLQSAGQDTVEANISLGLAVDARDFSVAGHILEYFKVASITLLTNNPEKLNILQAMGIQVVEHHSTPRFANSHNERYLLTKEQKLQHIFSPSSEIKND